MSSISCLNCKDSTLSQSEIVSLNCKHIFCWSCIASHVIKNLSNKIKCPLSTCNKNINDNIIRRALPETKVEEYEKLCLETFAKNEENCFKCLLPECTYIGFFNNKEVIFECASCKLFNCAMCNATHPFLSCKNYQEKIKSAKNNLADRNELKAMKEYEFANARKELNNLSKNKLFETHKLMESLNLVPNNEIFTCSLCTTKVSKGVGIQLRICYHMFCKDCLRKFVINSETVPITCPEKPCKAKLEDREINGILNDKEFKMYFEKSISQAQCKLSNVFHCKYPDCAYYGIIEDPKMKNFTCPLCKSINCVSCATVHKNKETCEQYLNKTKDMKTLNLIQKEIKKGDCMQCPDCSTIIKKDGGCNLLVCPSCKLELCWVLKMRRWGPGGRGDISGGCRCLVDQKPCDKLCLYGCTLCD